jgi:hypothetical protein
MPWFNTEPGPSQHKAWEEVQARVEALTSKRLEEWSRKLVDEQAGIQAKAQRAHDLAEESNKACSKMAQQLEELHAASFATVPQVEECIREKVEEMKNTWKVEAEPSDELNLSLTSRSMPKTVAAVFDDLHGRLEEWVSAIESRIYNIEQVIWQAVSLVDAAKTSSGNTPSSSSRVVTSASRGASAGEIEVQHPLEAWNAETPVVHCVCLALRKLEGDVDVIKKSSHERCDEVHRMGESFRSEIDEIQLSIKELSHTRQPSCAGRSPAKPSSGNCAGETTENTDSSCQTEAKQASDMQVAVQECSQRLDHVELDIVHVKDEIKAQAIALEVIQRGYKVQQTLPKVDGIHTDLHEVMPKAFNHGASAEIKAEHRPSLDSRTSPRKNPVVRRVTRGGMNTLRAGSPSGHEGTVSIRVAAAPDPPTTVQPQSQQPQGHQGQQAQQQPQPSQQPQQHRQVAAAAPLAHTAWRWSMLSSGAVPTPNRQLSPSGSCAAPPAAPPQPSLPPQLLAERFPKAASPSPSFWPTNRTGPKAVGRARSMDLQQPL